VRVCPPGSPPPHTYCESQKNKTLLREGGNQRAAEAIRKGKIGKRHLIESLGRIFQKKAVKLSFMGEHKESYQIKSMGAVLNVSRSGYYSWKGRQPSARQRDKEVLLRQIREVHSQSRRLYGSPRITAALKNQGFRCGKNRVGKLMKEHSIRALVKKRRFRRTTDSGHPYALASNLLVDRRQTEGVWASDITFVPTSEGWLYVAAVMNVKGRKVIGLSMSDKLSQELDCIRKENTKNTTTERSCYLITG
jgi:putative transposase